MGVFEVVEEGEAWMSGEYLMYINVDTAIKARLWVSCYDLP